MTVVPYSQEPAYSVPVKTALDVGVLVVTILLMVTVGMELEPRAFRVVARRKSLLLWTLLLPAILLPMLGFAVRNVGLAMGIAVTILNRIEFAEFALVYFLTEVPLLLAVVGVYRRWWAHPPLPVQPAGARQ